MNELTEQKSITVSSSYRSVWFLRILFSFTSTALVSIGAYCLAKPFPANGEFLLVPGILFLFAGLGKMVVILPFLWSLEKVVWTENILMIESTLRSRREIPVSTLRNVDVTYWSIPIGKLTFDNGETVRFFAASNKWYNVTDGTKDLLSLIDSNRTVAG